VTASGPSGSGGPRQGQARVSAIGSRRAAGEDFSASFHELQEEITGACRRQTKWEAKIVAGIQAALEFAATQPGKARALTIGARRPAFGERYPEQVVISYLAAQLSETAPDSKRVPISTDESIVEAMAVMVRGHLLGGTEDQLPEAAPDLVFLALLPYLGHAATLRWAESAVPLDE
jgi:hypothetical protein